MTKPPAPTVTVPAKGCTNIVTDEVFKFPVSLVKTLKATETPSLVVAVSGFATGCAGGVTVTDELLLALFVSV